MCVKIASSGSDMPRRAFHIGKGVIEGGISNRRCPINRRRWCCICGGGFPFRSGRRCVQRWATPTRVARRRLARPEHGRPAHGEIAARAEIPYTPPPDARNDQVRALRLRAPFRAHRSPAGLARRRFPARRPVVKLVLDRGRHGRRAIRRHGVQSRARCRYRRAESAHQIAPSARRDCSRAASPGASSSSGRWFSFRRHAN